MTRVYPRVQTGAVPAPRRERPINIAALALALLVAAPTSYAQTQSAPASAFVAVPGRRALVMGYPEQGLEIWAYPLQLLSSYRLRFREEGRTVPLDGEALLRRVEVGPSQTTRVYIGPDFVVRERLFTPLDRAGVRIDYEVEGRPDLRIEARFQPSLDLMWPGALGGQTVGWDAARSAYVEREAQHGFSATIASPQAVAHDDPVNAARGRSEELALVMEPTAAAGAPRRATLTVTADLGDGAPASAADLATDDAALQAQTAAHVAELSRAGLRIATPDAELDAAVRDAQTALDQAWVCAPRIGCGEVAGYGPSRPERRPQYAWFFGGDGLMAADGLVASGHYAQAREELAFVTRFQNPSNGMIWHEMSLAAPYIDWARYPYMYVHVDITLQYLATLARYETATGDRSFLAEHASNVARAWAYARSLLDSGTGLPAIPAGKEGQNEQAQLADDVRLTSAWIEAADAMAQLDRDMGRTADAVEAEAVAARARHALAQGGWDAAKGFWVEGHTLAGKAVEEDRSDAVGLLGQGVFTPSEVDEALDHLATPAFRTDWGERSLSAASPDFDPNAYSQGAVWALGTSATALAYWSAHRPLAAQALLQGLQNWNTLDSPGHLHEVLAGDLYHPEVESVPEQTWSSAGLLLAAVHGLFGLDVDAAAHRLSFAPHVPGDWDHAEVEGVNVGASSIALHLRQAFDSTRLEIDNRGPPVTVDFAPEIPLGASGVTADLDGAGHPATVERHAQDQHARLVFPAASGRTTVVIRYRGGVRVAPIVTPPQPGDASRNLQVVAATMEDGRLQVRANVADPSRSHIRLFTALRPVAASGGEVRPDGAGGYLLTLAPSVSAPVLTGGYRPAGAVVSFATTPPPPPER